MLAFNMQSFESNQMTLDVIKLNQSFVYPFDIDSTLAIIDYRTSSSAMSVESLIYY